MQQKNDTNIDIKNTFLKSYIKSDFQRVPLAFDASLRRYERIQLQNDQTYILMDASLDKSSVIPFIKMDKILVEQGYSAPKIIAEEISEGLLLLEDLGTDTYAKVLKNCDVHQEKMLYKNAIDVLVDIHKSSVQIDVPPYDMSKLIKEAVLLVDHYITTIMGCEVSREAREDYIEIWKDILQHLNYKSETLVLRDYHVDNLLYLSSRKGFAKVGLLDFQDAVIGSYAYDVVSLLEDARRDVPHDLIGKMIGYYLESVPSINKNLFLKDYTILGVQRSCKILGIFARKVEQDNDARYLQHLPRVISYIDRSINHPIMDRLRDWFAKNNLPALCGEGKNQMMI